MINIIFQAHCLEQVSRLQPREREAKQSPVVSRSQGGQSLPSWAPENRKGESLSRVRFFETPWTEAHQAPPSMGFSRQEHWSGLPFPSPGDLPDPGIEPRSPTLQADSLPSEPAWKLCRKNSREPCWVTCKSEYSWVLLKTLLWENHQRLGEDSSKRIKDESCQISHSTEIGSIFKIQNKIPNLRGTD